MTNGWFPRINIDGVIASGNNGIWITDKAGNSTQVSPIGTTPVWAGLTLVFNRNNGTTNVGDNVVQASYNDYVGSELNRWAGFLAPDGGRVEAYDGVSKLASEGNICAPRFGGNRFAYISPYQTSFRNLVVDNEVVASGLIDDVQFSRAGEFYCYSRWVDGKRHVFSSAGDDMNIIDDEVLLLAFVGPNHEPWVMTNTQMGVFVRPLSSPMGYLIEGDLYYPDARVFGDHLHVVGSLSNGMPRFDIKIYFAAPRMDLTQAGKPPVDPPVPVPPDPTPVPPEPVPVPPDPTPVPPDPPARMFTKAKGSRMDNVAAGLRMGDFFLTVDPTPNQAPWPGWFLCNFEHKNASKPHSQFKLAQDPSNNKLRVTCDAMGEGLLSGDAGEHGGGVCKQFYYKPNLDWGFNEQFSAWQLGSNGPELILVEYQLANLGKVSACLTVVRL